MTKLSIKESKKIYWNAEINNDVFKVYFKKRIF